MSKLRTFTNLFIILICILFGIDVWRGGIVLNNLINSYDIVVTIMILVGSLLFLYGVVLSLRLKKLSNRPVSFEEEDHVNRKMDKMYADVTLFYSISMAIFLYLLSTGFIVLRESHPGIVLIAFGLLIATFSAHLRTYYLVKEIYPERNYPETDDEQFQEKLFKAMDDGERHIILQAYYKIFRMINPLLATAIMSASIYSAFTGESQIFSIALMTIALIVIDTTYFITVREH